MELDFLHLDINIFIYRFARKTMRRKLHLVMIEKTFWGKESRLWKWIYEAYDNEWRNDVWWSYGMCRWYGWEQDKVWNYVRHSIHGGTICICYVAIICYCDHLREMRRERRLIAFMMGVFEQKRVYDRSTIYTMFDEALKIGLSGEQYENSWIELDKLLINVNNNVI